MRKQCNASILGLVTSQSPKKVIDVCIAGKFESNERRILGSVTSQSPNKVIHVDVCIAGKCESNGRRILGSVTSQSPNRICITRVSRFLLFS